jgi:hypothetical protein
VGQFENLMYLDHRKRISRKGAGGAKVLSDLFLEWFSLRLCAFAGNRLFLLFI